MSVEQFFTENDKVVILNKIINGLSLEVYRMCFFCNIDPDFFDYSNYVNPSDVLAFPREKILADTCTSLGLAIKKLESLQNA